MPIIASTKIAIFALLDGTTCRNRTHIAWFVAKGIIHYTKVVLNDVFVVYCIRIFAEYVSTVSKMKLTCHISLWTKC